MKYTNDELIRLAKNPNYVFSEEQLKQLKAAQKDDMNVMNRNVVVKHTRAVQKHNPDMPQVEDEE